MADLGLLRLRRLSFSVNSTPARFTWRTERHPGTRRISQAGLLRTGEGTDTRVPGDAQDVRVVLPGAVGDDSEQCLSANARI